MTHKTRLAAIACFCFLPLHALAETWDVTVGNNFFSPNDLTIQVGDTVRWTNNSGFHDVTADDGSWASSTGSSFTYSRTFNSVEEVLYYCSVHSEPGRNIQTSMNGRINVVGPQQSGFQINEGLTDAWYNSATSGQGLFITVWPTTELIFVAWFTYDSERPPEDVTAIVGEPGHRWMTAQGGYADDTANLTINVTRGGTFDSAEPPVTRNPDGDGTMTIEFADCNQALVTYELPELGLTGEIPITRIVGDNIPFCESFAQ